MKMMMKIKTRTSSYEIDRMKTNSIWHETIMKIMKTSKKWETNKDEIDNDENNYKDDFDEDY